jgi:DNA repair protein RadC
MKHNPPTLEQAMNYAEMMEACASYIAVKKPRIKEPQAVYRLMAPLFQDAKQESFFVLLLDTKSNIIGAPQEITRGLIDSCPVHPREVFRQAITESASAVVIIHNITTRQATRPRAWKTSTPRADWSKLRGLSGYLFLTM